MSAQPTASSIQFEQATSHRRLGARLIDIAILASGVMPISLIIVLPIAAIMDALNVNPSAEVAGRIMMWVTFATMVLIVFGYEILMTHLAGRTVGKMVLGMRVVDINGEKIDWGSSFLRAIFLVISLIVAIFLVVISASILGWIIYAALPKYARFPHDAISKSYVVREYRGQLQPAAVKPTPISDLDRLREQGLISQEEYERKIKEMSN